MSTNGPEQVISAVIIPRVEPETRTRHTSLEPGAEYGNLPFDRFFMENWDFEVPESRDQDQWNDLAQRWLTFSNTDRHKYWDGFPEESPPSDAPYLASRDQIRKIFTPHQSLKERNLAVSVAMHGGIYPIWLRTHYSVESDAVFAKMIADAMGHHADDPNPVTVLDDEADYGNLAENWTRVFLRNPSLVESLPFDDTDKRLHDEDMAERIQSLPTEPSRRPIANASLNETLVVYLFDEQGMRDEVVKLMFVDTHGKQLWWLTLEAEYLDNFNALYTRGGMLSRIMENLDGNDDPLLKQGAPLNWHY